MTTSRLWTKNYILGTFINFLLLLNYYLLMIIMADYSVKIYNASDSSAGLSASIFFIGAVLSRLFAAKLMDKIGQRALLLLGTSLEVIASVMYFFDVNMLILFAIRLIHGISYGIASTSVSTIVTGLLPEGRHGEGTGYFMLSITLGAAIGPFLGMSLIEIGGFSHVFIACIITASLCLVGAFFIDTAPPNQHIIENKGNNIAHDLKNFFEMDAVPISIICAGIFFCYSGIISFLAPYSEEIHLETAASFFFIVYSIAIFITRPFTGRMFDKKGERTVMLPAFLSFFLGTMILSQSHSGLVLLISAAFSGFGVSTIQSCGLASAVKKASPNRVSYANSTFYLLLDLGVGIGPLLLGFLIPIFGYRGMYLTISICGILLGSIYYIFTMQKKEIFTT